MTRLVRLDRARLDFSDGGNMRLDAGTTDDLFELLRCLPDRPLKRASASFTVEGEARPFTFTSAATNTTAYAEGLRIILRSLESEALA